MDSNSLRSFRQLVPPTDVILITGFGTLERAVEAVREGAFDFISKPFIIQEVIDTARRALDQQKSASTSREAELPPLQQSAMIGRSRKMIEPLSRDRARCPVIFHRIGYG